MLSRNAIYLLQKRYCMPNETPEGVFKRVAAFVADGDPAFEKRLYELMVNGVFLPNSPCLFNAGKEGGSLHACYVLPVSDDIYSIFMTISNMARIFKAGGGVGINFAPLREKGAELSGGGTSSGQLSFMELFDKVVDTVKQGGVRRGALMGITEYNHPDIFDFIRIKLEKRLQNFNLSIMVTDEFMSAVESDNKKIPLVSPLGYKVGYVRPKDIFEVAAFAAWCNGDPAFLFFDRINKDNPLYPNVVIRATNPCLAGDTYLLDGDRLVSIKDVKEGQTLQAWSSGRKHTILLRVSNGMQITCTPDHLLQLQDGEWCQAGASLGKALAFGRVVRDVSSVNINDSMYVKGIFFGSKALHITSSNKLELHRTFGKDVTAKLTSLGFEKTDAGYIGAIPAFLKPEEISELNKPAKYRILPDSIMGATSDEVLSFIKGYIRSSGRVARNWFVMACPNESIAHQMQVLLASFGIYSTLFTTTRIVAQLVKHRARTATKIRTHNKRWFVVKVQASWIPDEPELWKVFFDRRPRTIDDKYDSSTIIPRVVGISTHGEIEVFDFKMNSNNPYNFANGIIAHNCSEVGLPDWGACCLGSINLSKFVWKDTFNFEKFADVCMLGMRALTNLNRLGYYPLPSIKESMERFNPVGLGIMGFADCLIKLSIFYDSDECLDFINQLGAVYKKATEEFSNDFYFYRRVIAPTGSLSILADCSSGIEPVYDTTFERRLVVGLIEETRDLYKSKYVRTAHQVSPEWHVKVLAEWQKWVDGGISKTVNLPSDASVDDVKKIYKLAWKKKCKGITVYRDGCREDQVLRTKTNKFSMGTVTAGKCSDDTCIL